MTKQRARRFAVRKILAVLVMAVGLVLGAAMVFTHFRGSPGSPESQGEIISPAVSALDPRADEPKKERSRPSLLEEGEEKPQEDSASPLFQDPVDQAAEAAALVKIQRRLEERHKAYERALKGGGGSSRRSSRASPRSGSRGGGSDRGENGGRTGLKETYLGQLDGLMASAAKVQKELASALGGGLRSGPSQTVGQSDTTAAFGLPAQLGGRRTSGSLGSNGGPVGLERPDQTFGTRVPARSLSPGTYVDAVLEREVNSDIPGHFTARVRFDVYDSVTGRELLIPAGSKIVGVYSSADQVGQRRLALAPEKFVTPDHRVYLLPAIEVADRSGQTGLHDRVNHHTFSTLMKAAMVGLVSAAVQLGQPSDERGDGRLSSREIAAGAAATEFGRAASRLIDQGAQRRPTLRIRRGTVFRLFVNRTLTIH